MARVEGYINGRFITIIDDVVPSKDDPKAKKSKPEPLTEARVRAEYGFDIACIVEHFNYLLKGNTLAATLLPLTEVNIFYRIYEGVLLCAFANLLMPDSVDPKTVTIKPDLLDDTPDGERRKMENRNIGVTVLRALGLFADIEVTDKINMEHPFGMIGILVQILRLSTTGQMHFRKFELLIQLFDGWTIEEEASSNLATERETILLIWINYQLKKAGTDFQLKDFGENLSDSKAYSLLIWTVAPEDKRGSLISSDDIMSQSDLTKRAELVIANAAKLGIVGGLKPEHIANAGKQDINNPKGLHNIVLNLAFLFRIFLTYPNISVSNTKEESAAATPKPEPAAPKAEPAAPKAEPAAPKAEPAAPKAEPAAPKPEPAAPKPEPAAPKAATSKAEAVTPQKQVNELCKYGVQEDTLIRWLNSFGPSSPVVSLRTDLCNGQVLLEVWDAMYPGCVNWKAVKLQQVSAARRKFNWAVNCDIAIGIGEKHGISKNVCSSSNIASGDVKYIASMVFLMMRLHAQLTRKLIIGDSKAAELDDNGLVKWFNEKMEKFGNTFRLKNLEDPNLKKTNVLGFFGERVLVECKLYSKGSEAAAWFFNSVDQVASDPALLKRFEALCLFMFSKAGIIVYASRLGPEIDTAVYRSVLMELNALSLRSK